jgi:hypothetical protein
MAYVVWITLRVLDLPGYKAWASAKRALEPELVTRLDSREVTLPRRELGSVSAVYFEELLDDLRWSLEEAREARAQAMTRTNPAER